MCSGCDMGTGDLAVLRCWETCARLSSVCPSLLSRSVTEVSHASASLVSFLLRVEGLGGWGQVLAHEHVSGRGFRMCGGSRAWVTCVRAHAVQPLSCACEFCSKPRERERERETETETERDVHLQSGSADFILLRYTARRDRGQESGVER